MKSPLNILFMGTPDFAVDSLDSIYRSKHNLCCVVTSEDKRSGRGLKYNSSPVKDYCISNKIDFIQPNDFKSNNFLNQIKEYNPDIIVVVAFKILPKEVWSIPSIGTVNIHASLLPNLRGAAPINWAIINGLKKTGLTSFYINQGIDTGDIILQSEIEIKEDDNFGSLYEKLKKKTGNFILTTLECINNGVRKSQLVTTKVLSAPKLNKENTRINWSNSGNDICNQIKGLSPIPGAWSTLKQSKRNIKIYDAIFHKSVNNKECGEMFVLDKNKLMVIVNDGLIEIKKLQIEGKKKINANDFINGMKEKTIKLI